MFTEVFLETIDSTHLFALRLLTEGKRGSFFFYAGEQSGGVGRKNAPWIADGKENILGTFFFPLSHTKEAHNLSQLLAYSILTVLEKEPIEPLFKWPNDILLSYKKVCGVLSDIRDNHAVVSFGLNVNMKKETLDLIPIPATSLFEETQSLFPLDSLRHSIIGQFSSNLPLFFEKGFAPFFPPFASKLAFIGKKARINETTGIIVGLHNDGRLILQQSNKEVLFSTGSLELL